LDGRNSEGGRIEVWRGRRMVLQGKDEDEERVEKG
jgi:hypothetical protein